MTVGAEQRVQAGTKLCPYGCPIKAPDKKHHRGRIPDRMCVARSTHPLSIMFWHEDVLAIPSRMHEKGPCSLFQYRRYPQRENAHEGPKFAILRNDRWHEI